jgi:hypothetical protein
VHSVHLNGKVLNQKTLITYDDIVIPISLIFWRINMKPIWLVVIIGMLCSSCQGQFADKPEPFSSADPSQSNFSLLMSQEPLPPQQVIVNTFWLTDPLGIFSRMSSINVLTGESAKAMLVPAETGNLTVCIKLDSGAMLTKNLGKVNARSVYSILICADKTERSWANELWYSTNGNESNHICIYVYDKEFPHYFP